MRKDSLWGQPLISTAVHTTAVWFPQKPPHPYKFDVMFWTSFVGADVRHPLKRRGSSTTNPNMEERGRTWTRQQERGARGEGGTGLASIRMMRIRARELKNALS